MKIHRLRGSGVNGRSVANDFKALSLTTFTVYGKNNGSRGQVKSAAARRAIIEALSFLALTIPVKKHGLRRFGRKPPQRHKIKEKHEQTQEKCKLSMGPQRNRNAPATRRERQLRPSGRRTQQEPFARRSREKVPKLREGCSEMKGASRSGSVFRLLTGVRG